MVCAGVGNHVGENHINDHDGDEALEELEEGELQPRSLNRGDCPE